MKNEKMSSDEQFIINIICGPITGVMCVFSMFVFPSMLFTIFVLVLSISVGYSLIHIWRPVVNPFTPEEWKRVGRLIALSEGIINIEKHDKHLIVKDMVLNRGKFIQFHVEFGIIDGKSFFDFSSEKMVDQLKESILLLPLQDQKVRIDANGSFIASPWLAARDLYWKNREKARFTI